MITTNTISGTGIVDKYNYCFHVPLPSQRVEMLSDVLVSLHGLFPIMGLIRGTIDLRVLSGDADFTPFYLKSLSASLKKNNAVFLAAYKKSIQAWQAALGKGGFVDYGGDREADSALCAKLLSTTSITSLVSVLGDVNFGWNGVFGLFNHLSRTIKAPPVSFASLLEEFNAAEGGSLDIASVIANGVTFVSKGVSLETNFADQILGAFFYYDFTLVYENEEVDLIIDEMKKIAEYIGSNGSLDKLVKDLTRVATATAAATAALEKRVNDLASEADVNKNSIAALAKVVDRLPRA